MSIVFEIPKEYGYVVAVATATLFVNTFHKTQTSIARSASGIKYPAAYATEEQAARDPKAMKFNLAQRSHANFTENVTSFLAAVLISGLRYPGPAAWAGAAWVTGRFAYGYAYTNYGPSGRLPGYVLSQLAKVSLNIMAVLTSYYLIQGE